MTDTNVTVTDAAGTVIAQLIVPEGKTPAQAGWPVSPSHRFFTVPKRGDQAVERFNATTGAWEAAPALVEAQLIAAIKDEAERRKMTMATPGGMKKAEYAEKRAEVMAWKALGANIGAILAALELLPMATRQTRFAHAIADSAAFGDKLQDAIARFEKGMTVSAPTVQIAAVEAKTCAAIRAATTATAKRAAAAAIGWPA